MSQCACHAQLKSYFLTYLPGGETSWGRIVKMGETSINRYVVSKTKRMEKCHVFI